jgi:hypothetical protein
MGLALEHREVGDSQNPGVVLLQEHHLLAWAMEGPPLLDAPLQGALASIPLLAGPDLLQVEQQGLRIQFGAFSSNRLAEAFGYGTSTLSHTSASGSARVRQWRPC